MLQLTTDAIPFFAILIYLPFVCISDWRTRSFDFLYFIPLICVCAPFTYWYFIGSPERNYMLIGVTLLLCLVWLALAFKGIIGGGDFVFASIIMIFIQDYPFVVPRTWFPLDFFLITWLCACILPILAYFHNARLHYDRPLWRDKEGEYADSRLEWYRLKDLGGSHRWIKIEEPYSFKRLLTEYPGGFPYTIVISLAFLVTVVVGVLT